MVLDTSAVIALLFEENDAPRLRSVLFATPLRKIGAPTLVEAGMVMGGKNVAGYPAFLDGFVENMELLVVPFTHDHAAVARAAFERFGKGRHPASLNYGDCMSYAVALMENEPLLFKGNDFAQTDILAAAY
ncbi:MAG: type II toxin-antitoxin system VapC family toxin [Alphaproteobacteria bacterium]|nr:type II toxin-antitoxin system VapC family toxin [Alphaproteobacteria bacterium]